MKRLLLICAAVAVVSQLAACGEKPQTATTRRVDEKVWQSSDSTFTAAGYKPGDKAAWDDQERTRAESQNEYAKTK
jgi:hypothetical protein